MGRFMSHPSGGPCWSRDKGYHTPPKLPAHVWAAIAEPRSLQKRHPKPEPDTNRGEEK